LAAGGLATYHPRVPIYEYLCEACGRISEVMQKMTDPSPKSCPECGSKKIAKLVSRSAFQLKGGGWYADLYSSRKKGAPASDAAPPKSPDAASPKSSDAAPAESKPGAAGEKSTPTGKSSTHTTQPAEKKTASK
jgi:putative FmdB family regulatory protein